GEFDLQLCFFGVGTLAEDFEDQPKSVHHRGIVRETPAEIISLIWAESIVENHRIRPGFGDERGEFVDFPVAEMERGVFGSGLGDLADDGVARRACEIRDLPDIGAPGIDPLCDDGLHVVSDALASIASGYAGERLQCRGDGCASLCIETDPPERDTSVEPKSRNVVRRFGARGLSVGGSCSRTCDNCSLAASFGRYTAYRSVLRECAPLPARIVPCGSSWAGALKRFRTANTLVGEVVRLYGDDIVRVRTCGVPPEGFVVEFEEGMAPSELREESFSERALAENATRARERLDGRQLKGCPVVHRIRCHQKRQRTVWAAERKALLVGRLPRTIERDEAAFTGAVVTVGGRERTLGVGIQHDARRRGARRPMERCEVEPGELSGGAFVGVVVALVPDV